MASDESRQVGLFLDFENLVIAFDRAKKLDPNKIRIDTLIDFLEETFGNVIFRRAYADWSGKLFSPFQDQLQDLGVEMIQVRRRTRASKKNGADILLTADAVECLLLRPYLSVYTIVSGDSDIGPLITRLRSHGKMVVVIGPDAKSTAKHVIQLADRFKYFNDVVSPNGAKESGDHPKTPQEQVMELLERAGKPVESATLKRRLTSIPRFKSFQEKALGFKTWTTFLESIDGVIVDRRSDLGIEVHLDR